MEIKNLRPTRGAGTLVAHFDLAMTPDITLIDWQLRQTNKGLRAYPPSTTNGRPAVIFDTRNLSEIGRLAATAFMEGDAPHDATH